MPSSEVQAELPEQRRTSRGSLPCSVSVLVREPEHLSAVSCLLMQFPRQFSSSFLTSAGQHRSRFHYLCVCECVGFVSAIFLVNVSAFPREIDGSSLEAARMCKQVAKDRVDNAESRIFELVDENVKATQFQAGQLHLRKLQVTIRQKAREEDAKRALSQSLAQLGQTAMPTEETANIQKVTVCSSKK